MGGRIYNRTQEAITLKDYYVWDPATDSGYYGALQYFIPAGGNRVINPSTLVKKAMEEKIPQEVHVKTGEEKLLILYHEQFEDDKEIVLDKGSDGLLTATFRARGKTSFAHRIWGLFPSWR